MSKKDNSKREKLHAHQHTFTISFPFFDFVGILKTIFTEQQFSFALSNFSKTKNEQVVIFLEFLHNYKLAVPI